MGVRHTIARWIGHEVCALILACLAGGGRAGGPLGGSDLRQDQALSRSQALVGKLFPTSDVSHAQPLRTASFITQQDIGGERTDYINNVELRNAPDVHAWRRGGGVPILLITGIVFQRVDKEPAQRQLYQIASISRLLPKGCGSGRPRAYTFLVSVGRTRILSAVCAA
jgi:hypothetical protein